MLNLPYSIKRKKISNPFVRVADPSVNLDLA